MRQKLFKLFKMAVIAVLIPVAIIFIANIK